MKITVCPNCSRIVDRQEVESLNEYRTLVNEERCAQCLAAPETAEQKLLDAIFAPSYVRISVADEYLNGR
ncbi:hypothetical protein LCGC14_1326150 [marine sediment metagenome]|uniref:Uncharacterized protein n=1 Tax=marine sediment metagenome TaxID=412755 RepID=A0A0F9KI74_9ZZZZ